MKQPVPVVAAFDFDGTITTSDTFVRFCFYAAGWTRGATALFLILPFLLAYSLRLLTRQQLKEKLLTLTLGGVSADQYRGLAMKYAEAVIPPLVRQAATDRIQWHLSNGHRVILVSASLDAYLIPWAKAIGIPEVVATQLQVSAGVVTGKIDGTNCRGLEKVQRLKQLLGERAGYKLLSYGDSPGDRELLAYADEAYYRPF